MFCSAGLDTTNIQNHSLCVTGISHMYFKGVSEKQIMEQSGHRSVGGVCSYERTSGLQKKQVSETLSSKNFSLQVNTAIMNSGCSAVIPAEKNIKKRP